MPASAVRSIGTRWAGGDRVNSTGFAVAATATVLLALMAPLLAVLVVMVVANSRGPVLVRRAVGLAGGRAAYVTEYRTHRLLDAERYDVDPVAARRITLVGRLLRLTGFFRLPRLLDVRAGRIRLRDLLVR